MKFECVLQPFYNHFTTIYNHLTASKSQVNQDVLVTTTIQDTLLRSTEMEKKRVEGQGEREHSTNTPRPKLPNYNQNYPPPTT